MAKVISHHTVYRSKQFFSAFPSVAKTRSGKICLAFRRAPDHRWLLGDIAEEDFNSVDHVHFRSHIAFGYLDREGHLAGEPTILPVHAEAGDQDGNLFVSKAGRLFQYSFRWYPVTKEIADKLTEVGQKPYGADYLGAGYIYHSSYVRYSDDDGQSWSQPIEIPRDPLCPPTGRPEIVSGAALRGRMIELENGDLLLPTYIGGLNGNEYDGSRIMISRDHGESWAFTDHYFHREDGSLQEPTLAHWPPGKVTIFHRTTNNDDRLITAEADDEAIKFGALKCEGVVGHPYDAQVLSDGRLFLVYGYRHQPMGVRARVVSPGQDLADAEELVIRDDSRSRDTGYPSAVELEDGRVLVTYYIPDDKGIRGIDASIVDPS